jgi:polyhydroxybutyrate depolymerase
MHGFAASVRGVLPGLVAVVLAAPPAAAGTLVQNATLVHGGITRYFDYWVPDGLGGVPVPLLFALHGGTVDKSTMQFGAALEYRAIADEEGVLVVYPNGTSPTTGLSGPTGAFNWNDCRADAGSSATTADDVGFIGALIDWAAGTFAIDLERVYATGASNGGLMSYRLAFELSDRIAAVGAVIANLPANSECSPAPAHPVAVLTMNGTADAFMPFGGGMILGNTGTVLSAQQTIDFWRTFVGAGPTPTHVDFPDVDPADGGTVALDVWCGGTGGTAYAFHTVAGGGHNMPSIAYPLSPALIGLLGPQNHDIEGAREVWGFLKHHRLGASPAACGNRCLDPSELCDNGSFGGGDCCASSCDAFLGCPACEACDPGLGACTGAPRAPCRSSILPEKTKLILKDQSPDDGDRVVWRWVKGAATATGDFGDPVGTDDYALCVYDESAGGTDLLFRAEAPAGGTCGARPCWKTLAGGGFRYSDAETTPDGLRTVLLRPGAGGAAKAIVKGRGANLSNRPAGLPSLPLALPVRVQLHGEHGECWEAAYGPAGVQVNDAARFKASGEP